MTPLERQLLDMEGEKLSAYQDHLGYWTIGIGHLVDARKGGRIPVSVSRELLSLDVKEKTQQVSRELPWTAHLDEVRFGALVNMAFQLGIEGLKKFTKTLLLLKAGKYKEAATEALDSTWAKQTPERAKRIANQIRTGEWS